MPRRTPPAWSQALVLLVLLAAGATVRAQDDIAIVVRRLTFVGVNAIDESRLREILATRQSSRLPWGRRQYFDRGRFDVDLKRITAFYADRGYPDARVTTFDVRFNDEKNAVDVSVTIDEGSPVVVTAVEFSGFEVLPDEHFQELTAQAPLKVDSPHDRQLVVQTSELAANELRDHGYPYAKVATDEDTGPSGKEARVVFTADPGPLAHFGPIEIVGNRGVTTRIIERQLTYRSGDLYRRSAVQTSQRRLYGMELFQFVNIETLDPNQQSPQVWTRVTVVEGNHQRINFGVGYGTEEKARVDGEYHHVNFFGGARTAGLHARWSSLDRGVRTDFRQPYLFSPSLSLNIEGQQWHTNTPAYRSIITGGRGTLIRLAGSASFSASFIGEYTSSAISADALNDPTLRDELIALGLDPTTGRQEGALNAIALDFRQSTADNLLNAARGYQLALHAEQAGRGLPGSFNYFSVSADVRHYLPIGSRTVVASRLQAGSIDAAQNDPRNVPFSKKYFLGGATSIRGWGRYEVSPLSGSGLPIGGNSLLAFNAEMRRVLRGRFGAVLFLDAGNVWADGWTIRPDELLYAGGAGLRYETPVGPVRFDVGYQLNPLDDLLVDGELRDRRWRLHFSIGQAF
jgi:outer membrane protein assembly complex protein YaeT